VISRGSQLPPSLSALDLILAADCVYFEPAFPLLIQTLCDLVPCSSFTEPELLFCYKKRRKVPSLLFSPAALPPSLNLCIPHSSRPTHLLFFALYAGRPALLCSPQEALLLDRGKSPVPRQPIRIRPARTLTEAERFISVSPVGRRRPGPCDIHPRRNIPLSTAAALEQWLPSSALLSLDMLRAVALPVRFELSLDPSDPCTLCHCRCCAFRTESVSYLSTVLQACKKYANCHRR